MKMNRKEAIAGMRATAVATYLPGNLTAHAASGNSDLKDVYAYINENYD